MAPRPGLKDSLGGLLVTWTPGDGDLDMYVVSLSTTVSPVAPITFRVVEPNRVKQTIDLLLDDKLIHEHPVVTCI